MKVALYTTTVSEHQLPFASELVNRIGCENYRYVYSGGLRQGGAQELEVGQSKACIRGIWCVREDSPEAKEWLRHCDVLVCCFRDLDLIERRSQDGLLTFYMNERWFKPILLRFLGVEISLPGSLRMLSPAYRCMVHHFKRLIRDYDSFSLLPIGRHAAMDFKRLGIASERMKVWGYFVAPSTEVREHKLANSSQEGHWTKVLWVGRMLKLKNVDVLINACERAALLGCHIRLTIVGDGEEKLRLLNLAERALAKCKSLQIEFLPPVSLPEVRRLMRSNEVYVFPSNAFEGWGAVVSEALEEEMLVLGSYESGAPATILPDSCLFHCQDIVRLSQLLVSAVNNRLPHIPIGPWAVSRAADWFVKKCLEVAR